MKDSARYAKIVEWSEEDQCYVGSSPGLIYAGCHGQDEAAVFLRTVRGRGRDDHPVPCRWQALAARDLRAGFREQDAECGIEDTRRLL
jgi:hypothetical protein